MGTSQYLCRTQATNSSMVVGSSAVVVESLKTKNIIRTPRMVVSATQMATGGQKSALGEGGSHFRCKYSPMFYPPELFFNARYRHTKNCVRTKNGSVGAIWRRMLQKRVFWHWCSLLWRNRALAIDPQGSGTLHCFAYGGPISRIVTEPNSVALGNISLRLVR